ncbi:hypothetical protein [Actibacterium ureilyticum]|uniref:hypothetical protein n=1 Tax=Actibacterium ureilyticum TaxID=1590614 RepID=UPI000BAA9E37|nr:hypothetical protein [Actibacterium ureilyticum]
MTEPLATVSPSKIRRLFGLSVLLLLGGGVIYIALAQPPAERLWQLFLLGFGGVVLWQAETFRRATLASVILTEAGLVSSDGTVLAPMDQITGVDRGVFAMKPSNGFVVRLKSGGKSAWAPGLWWRLGRRVGVGGVTVAAQTKFMSEILIARLAERDGS